MENRQPRAVHTIAEISNSTLVLEEKDVREKYSKITHTNNRNIETKAQPKSTSTDNKQYEKQMSELKQEAETYAVWWSATSKVSIGDCPSGSIWEMRFGADEGGKSGRNIISPECKSITPKAITDFDYVEINQDYAD